MNCTIHLIKYYLIVLLISFGFSTNGQSSVNSKIVEKVTLAMDKLNCHSDSLSQLLQYFCKYNKADTLAGSQIIDLVKVQPSMKASSKNEFYINIFNCLTEGQKVDLIGRLNSSLNRTDKDFHEVVSLYKLTKFKTYLEMHILNDFWTNLSSEILSSARLSNKIKFQYQNVITLGNLTNIGSTLYEDSIFFNINKIYNQVKITKNPYTLKKFYDELIFQGIANLNSRNSVIKTLYFLDEEGLYVLGEDTETTYLFRYFMTVIAQKISNANIIMLGTLSEIEENKEKIKDAILNDNTIWKKHIRL